MLQFIHQSIELMVQIRLMNDTMRNIYKQALNLQNKLYAARFNENRSLIVYASCEDNPPHAAHILGSNQLYWR